nr:myelin-oligodendrocyte glycoprotein-like [Misgurnus anguillicaudatus]
MFKFKFNLMSKFVKIKFLHCFLIILVISVDTLEFHVRGSGPLVVPLGGSVVLPCYVETPLVMERVKVEWTRTDSETLVHLFLNGDIRPEDQHQDYHDRAHFFTEDIKHGNFSLLLKNVREEDKGIYRCKVYSNKGADKTLVEIKDVGKYG